MMVRFWTDEILYRLDNNISREEAYGSRQFAPVPLVSRNARNEVCGAETARCSLHNPPS